jgi:DNA polymerase sigma
MELVEEWDLIINQILSKRGISEESRNMRQTKSDLIYALQEASDALGPGSVQLFGSSVTGFGSQGSDLDTTFLSDSIAGIGNEESVIESCARSLENSQLFRVERARGRFPMLKLVHIPTETPCDFVLNNRLQVRNSELLKAYTCVDDRVRPLGLAVKHWAKLARINDSSNGFSRHISSYALMNMLIFYLQHTKPAVLPCLQELQTPSCPKIPVLVGEWDTYFCTDIGGAQASLAGKNVSCVAQLFFGFFRYYVEEFDFETNAVCIRASLPLMRIDKEKKWTEPAFPVAVEDPFELSHNLTGVIAEETWKNFWSMFQRAHSFFNVRATGVFEELSKEKW